MERVTSATEAAMSNPDNFDVPWDVCIERNDECAHSTMFAVDADEARRLANEFYGDEGWEVVSVRRRTGQ